MAVRKFSICTKCWFKSGSKSFTLVTKKCGLLHADSWELEPLMPGRGELCFSSAFSFYFPFLSSPNLSPHFPFPCSSPVVSFTNPQISLISVSFCRCSCLLWLTSAFLWFFFFLCPSYSPAPHRIRGWQLFWLELGFTPTGVITPHCFSMHMTAELFPSTEQRGGFYK